MLFNNRNYTGGIYGTPVGDPSLFGFEISSIRYPGDTEFSSWEWLFSQLCWLPMCGVAVVVDV